MKSQKGKKKEKADTQGERPSFHRVNISLREDQYQLLQSNRYNLSGIIRDLIDDRFSSTKIVFNLSEEGKRLYDFLVANFGIHDGDLEPYFMSAMDEFLEGKAEEMTALRERVRELAANAKK